MLIRIRRPGDIRSEEVTDEAHYLGRRQVLRAAAGAAVGAALLPAWRSASAARAEAETEVGKLTGFVKSPIRTSEPQTAYTEASSYNNFYEFGTAKEDPAKHAHQLVTRPWSVSIEGEVRRPGVVPLDTLLAGLPLEERVYRLRCVEGWSMVIPWIGYPLRALLERLGPTSGAKFVEFRTLHNPEQMPGQRRPVLEWPYREGLRMDEAMHPLTILAVGMYGRVLPNQNGAPLRLVVPWKYGFKSIKSIVSIALRKTQPATSWSKETPREYGFYSNVNPDVDHPRWSQKSERRIGEFLRRATLPFNGYAEDVASLYAGMDLEKLF